MTHILEGAIKLLILVETAAWLITTEHRTTNSTLMYVKAPAADW